MESVKRYGVIPDMVYGHDKFGPVQSDTELPYYVRSEDFDRVSAENLALQQRLTVQDQRVDELEELLRHVLPEVLIDSSRRIESALNPNAEADLCQQN